MKNECLKGKVKQLEKSLSEQLHRFSIENNVCVDEFEGVVE